MKRDTTQAPAAAATLHVREGGGSYVRPFYIEDEHGRLVANLQANQLEPGGITIADAERYARMFAAAPQLVEALRPLARAADFLDRYDPEVAIWSRTSSIPGREFRLTAADCRRAREALRALGLTTEPGEP